MRLKCEYKATLFPIDNRMMIVALIKDAISRVNPDYYEKLYNFEGNNNKKIKNFAFSVSVKNYELKDNVFNVNDKVIVYITTPDYEFGINLYNGLLNNNHFKYKNYTLQKLKISLMKEKFINQSEVVLKTLSPICIKDKSNNFILPEDNNYEEELNYIVNTALTSFRGYGLKEKLKFVPVMMKKAVIKESLRTFTEVSGKETFYVNASSGIFKLCGDIEDLNYVYQCGIGFRRSQGFGMLDIV